MLVYRFVGKDWEKKNECTSVFSQPMHFLLGVNCFIILAVSMWEEVHPFSCIGFFRLCISQLLALFSEMNLFSAHLVQTVGGRRKLFLFPLFLNFILNVTMPVLLIPQLDERCCFNCSINFKMTLCVLVKTCGS